MSIAIQMMVTRAPMKLISDATLNIEFTCVSGAEEQRPRGNKADLQKHAQMFAETHDKGEEDESGSHGTHHQTPRPALLDHLGGAVLTLQQHRICQAAVDTVRRP